MDMGRGGVGKLLGRGEGRGGWAVRREERTASRGTDAFRRR